MILACFLLAASIFLKHFVIYIAIFVSWGGIIWIIADMAKSQDMTASQPIQYVAAIISLWALYQMFKSITKGEGL
jgi:hypothetical protein